jgi:hypothetical protein
MAEIEAFGVDETDPGVIVEVTITRVVDEAKRSDCDEILRATSVVLVES